MRIRVTFTLPDDDEAVDADHETGLSEDGWMVLGLVLNQEFGAYDIEVERA